MDRQERDKKLLTRVQSLFSYDERGLLIRKMAKGRWRKLIGKPVDCTDANGYLVVRVDNKNYLVHQLVWLIHYGYLPEQLDHWDRDNSNNRIGNLRECSQANNSANSRISMNNTSGYKGVCWDKSRQKWMASIMKDYKAIHIGRFYTAREAAEAYNEKAIELFGEFAALNTIPGDF